MTKRYWDDESHAYIICEVVYAGRGAMPHQERYAEYCWQQRESMLLKAAPDTRAYPTVKEVRKANLVPCDDLWRAYPEPVPPHVRCQSCGRAYKPVTAVTKRRFCPLCRGKVGRPRKAA